MIDLGVNDIRQQGNATLVKGYEVYSTSLAALKGHTGDGLRFRRDRFQQALENSKGFSCQSGDQRVIPSAVTDSDQVSQDVKQGQIFKKKNLFLNDPLTSHPKGGG